MRCPFCQSQISDNELVCPACHTDLSKTQVMPKLSGTWCQSCGALVPFGAKSCPKCGMVTSNRSQASYVNLSARAPEAATDADSTTSLPRFESAIPSEPNPASNSYGKDRLPRTKTFLFAALASLVIVGGGVILITHPWDPSLTDTRATMPADTSQAGFPGEVDRLSGQDKSATESITVVSADEQTYTNLSDAYGQLKTLSDEADTLEEELDSTGITGSAEERESGYSRAHELSLAISNLATTISNIDTATTGTYTEQKQNIATLASWLRNRIEAIEKSWSLSAQSTDPEADALTILAPMAGNRTTDGTEAYVNLFSANYDAYKPTQG